MRMIPEFIDDSYPPGEVALFRKLENAQYDWTVIHSLDLAPSNYNRRTELDFVIVIPDTGILCVEVKSHTEIGFDGYSWYPESIKKSPFRQAQDARFSLRRRLVSTLGTFSATPIVHCCIFPNAEFIVPLNLSIQPFEVMDKRLFKACGTGNELCDALKEMVIRIIKVDSEIAPLKSTLSAQQIDCFVNFCFPIRIRRPERDSEIRFRDEELKKLLRVQQQPVMKLVNYNPRVLVEGGAGTGKSLIGLGVARQKAAEGLRVGYLCFNRLIGQWATSQLSIDQNPLLIGGSILRVLMSLTGVEVLDKESECLWGDIVLAIQERLTDPEYSDDFKFDYLVIDETQDILARPELLDCISLLLDGGLTSGCYLMLGDFYNQVMTNHRDFSDSFASLRGNSARWVLNENCRNYKAIGQIAMKLSRADQNTYSGYLRQGGGIHAWSLELYKDPEDQIQKIKKSIDLALADGFLEEDITLLSFCAEHNSVLPKLRSSCTFSFTNYEGLGVNGIRWSSVHAYKGLENKVIIITDVSPSGPGFERNRFYTGITRAQERLYLFCHASGASQLTEWITSEGK